MTSSGGVSPIPPSRRALLRYIVAWAIAGAAIAFAVVSLLHTDDEVSLPPVKQTDITDAVRAARCDLRRETAGLEGAPAVEGGRGRPAAPRVYTDPPDPMSLVAAIRRGTIVIHYRPGLPEEFLEALEDVQRTVPTATIVTPNPEMSYDVAVTAWRRLLGCRRFNAAVTIDAIRLFRGRFVGTGPDE